MKKKIYRQRLDAFVPQWDDTFAGYAKNLAVANEWRFGADIAADDLFQEFWIKFDKLATKYAGKVENGRHFMSLFQTACRNHLFDLARKKTRTVDTVALVTATEEDADEMYVPDSFDYVGEAELRATLANAPQIVQNIAAAALDGQGGYRKKENGSWEVKQQLLRRLSGVAGDHRATFARWFEREFENSRNSGSRVPTAVV